ncbi:MULTISPECIES: PAS domain S-box protein [unclassified Polaromonas]|uniref:PAS domain S-box protein n=1 Tax=unclassified Polaromonas TaxID=2638319 RepID=UPI000F07F691|nr:MULTISPECIES: PAS domain S-box protein [unclassified Polaromonas]AYQ27666.1 PAS domain S-box protein [Polaromonas sp. SP1]QGJ17486.1 PAS domain S-box protein [Polaromonas sp. Pch-P]
MLGWLGLRTRLVLLVLLALLPVFGLLVYSAEQSHRAALQLAQSSLQSQVLMLSARQQRTVDMVQELLNGMASSPYIKNPVPEMCGQHLKNLYAEHSEFNNLGVAALDGTLLCSATGAAGEFNVSDRLYFQQVMAGSRLAVGRYGLSRSTGQPGVGFAVPVRNDVGELSGVAFAMLGLKPLSQALEGVPDLADARLSVLDGDGTVLAVSPDEPSWVGHLHPEPVLRQAAQMRRQVVLQGTDKHGLARVYAVAPVPGGGRDGLSVAVSVPYELIAAPGRQDLAIELLVLLAVALFGVACAWWMGNRLIVNPAHAILKEANEVALGNMNARVKLGPLYQGELGEIGNSFNRMAESLQGRQQELDAVLGRVDKERGLLDLILNSMNEGVIAVDTEGRFLLFNAAARRIFLATPEAGMRVADWRRGHELLMLDGQTPFADAERPLTKALRGIGVDNCDMLLRRQGTEDRVLRVSTRPLRDTGGALVGGVMVFNDITELKTAENFALAQEQVLALIAGSAPLRQSLDAVVRLIEKSSPDSLCSILLLQGDKLHLGAAPSLPDSYNEAIEGLQIGEGVGACGTAAVRNALVVVEDTQVDPLMQDYRALMRTHGLRACWSTPVVSTDGEVLATFAIYRTYPCRPQAGDLELIAIAARLAGIALQRARAEEAVLSSEARFRELAENIHDVFYNVDPRTGRLLYISPAYEKIWGRSRESLYADPKSYGDAAVAEDQHLLKLARKRNRTGEISDIEYRIVSPDGAMRWIRDHSYPVFNASGVLERVVGTARDITASKLAELALASTNRALQMLSRSSIAINRLDEEAALLAEVCRVAVDVGDYRMAWVGYAIDDEAATIRPMAHAGEEAGYLSSIRLSWRDDEAAGQGPAGQAIRSGQPQQSGDISRADNHFHWHEAAMARGYSSAICLPLRDGPRSFGVLCLYSGKAQHFTADEIKLLQELADNLAFGIVSLRARLERRRAQEAARQAAAKLREQASLLDRAQDAIMVRNLDRTIRFWNKGAERLYGWAADEVLGKTMDQLMYHDPEVLAKAMAQTLANDGDWTGELEQRARDGSTVCIEARWTVVRDEQGRVNGVLGINSDIGERKRAREEIMRLNASLEERVQQRTAQLEFANKQLEAFSYSVSHDLRSPLSAIDGFSDLLERAIARAEPAPQTERNRHYLARIRAGVTQMGELIDAMLTLAHVSRSSLRWEPVDLSTLATAVLDGLREREPARQARIQVEPGLKGVGDPRLLKQVFDNLLGNAWKFSAKQPLTDITFGHEINPAGETVYFVRDKGAGFDMAYAEKLFGAFQRLHSLSEFAGTGIGLATVQRIVARHGGRVWAQSAPGQGATFYFTLGEKTL